LSVVGIFKNYIVAGTVFCICLIYFIVVFNRNSEWINNYTLYSSDIKKAPNSASINYLLGNELTSKVAASEPDPAKQRQIKDEGIFYLKKALAIFPEYFNAENYLAYTYLSYRQFDSAELHSERAMALNPVNTSLVRNVAGIYVMNKKYSKAIELFNKLIALDPYDAVSYANLGICYGSLGIYSTSAYYAKKAIALAPRDRSVYMVLISTYKLGGYPDSARKYEAIANMLPN
jgi:tetratricopeptide (TPR) repeat protein